MKTTDADLRITSSRPGKRPATTPRASAGGRAAISQLTDPADADMNDLRSLVAILDPSASFDAEAVSAAIRGGGTRIFVRRYRGRIMAAAALVKFSTPTGTHHRVEDVVVHPSMRGKGLGRKMMQHILKVLRDERAASVELTSRPSREAANALYRSLGFTLRETNVYEFRCG